MGEWIDDWMDGGWMNGNTCSPGKDRKTSLSYLSRVTRETRMTKILFCL